jgi:hypothetical protein
MSKKTHKFHFFIMVTPSKNFLNNIITSCSMATCPYVHMSIGPYVHMSRYPCPYIHVHMSITDTYKDMDKQTYGHGLGKWTGKMDKTSKITGHNSSLDSCLDKELPGTGLESRARCGEGEAKGGYGPPPSGGGSGSWNPAEIRET